MARAATGDIEELLQCASCSLPFDEHERAPKLLACQHHFCLSCARTVLARGSELCCALCWKRTPLPPPDQRAAHLPTHRAVLALLRRLGPAPGDDGEGCEVCGQRACRGCVGRVVPAAGEARAELARDASELRQELRRLAGRRREGLLRALDAATALKTRLEAELAAPEPAAPDAELWRAPGAGSLAALTAERSRLRARAADLALHVRLDELVRGATRPLDGEAVRRVLAGLPPAAPSPPPPRQDPLLLLGNYCLAQVHARRWASERTLPSPPPTGHSPLALSPMSPLVGGGAPHVFLDLEADGAGCGRVVLALRPDVAPRMSRNFLLLAAGARGAGYRGCSVFQCWEGESVIAGDFELNNGRGGRALLAEGAFLPDESRLPAARGAVGMRRSQRRHDTLGLVASQFRIVLKEMRGFTAIFAHVVAGLELVDRLSRAGDSSGKPLQHIVIANCGQLA